MRTHANVSKLFNYLGWILLFFILWYKGCQQYPQKAEKVKVVTKEVKGKIETKTKIVHVPITKLRIDTIKDKNLARQIEQLLEQNNQMQIEFAKMDSIDRAKAYAKATQINEFKQSFDDKYISGSILGEVQGEVKRMSIDYTIKKQVVEVNAPKVKNHLYIGFGMANTLQFDKLLFNAGIGIQNKKGRILTATFDNEKRIGIGYGFRVF